MKEAGLGWRTLVAAVVVGAFAVLAVVAAPGGVAGAPVAEGRPLAAAAAATDGVPTEQQVQDLVGLTCAAVRKDVKGAFAAIDAGEAPYKDPSNAQLYAFVYDTRVTLISTPDATTRGQNMSGRPDATGKYFRDEIVAGALEGGSGWVTYVYKQPEKTGLFQKATFYRLTSGSDGKQYVVCAGRYLGEYTGPVASTTSATLADVQVFVKDAVAYAKRVGKAQALETFTAAGGDFHKGELYIYAYDYKGDVIAHGGDPSLVGKNLWTMTDPNGVKVIQRLTGLASSGGGWLYFTWPNPATGEAQAAKLGYVLPVDKGWFLGSGTYGPAAQQPPTTAVVRSFVDQAYAYARVHGRKAALAEFNRKDGSFYRAELYIFAYDRKGRCLSLPNQPELVGTDRWDYRDRNGKYVVREMVKIAKGPGRGWLHYQYANPAQGYAIQDKSSYVRDIGGTWLIGAGTYRPD
jgi:polar amino acid transport system substrate-binding protein